MIFNLIVSRFKVIGRVNKSSQIYKIFWILLHLSDITELKLVMINM